jgi:signal transduction histidine kinase
MASLIDRLAAHRLLSTVPREELEWVAAHGELQRYDAGVVASRSEDSPDQLVIILEGRIAIYVERGGGRQKPMEWKAGDVTGMLPYSRMGRPPGDTVAEEPTEVLAVHQSAFPEMIRSCPQLTAALVHLMLDRARHFVSYDLRDEKIKSLGRLSAGLAHELNNPASAAERSAARLVSHLSDLDQAARSLGAAGLSPAQLAVVDAVRSDCQGVIPASVRSPMEQADREDEIATWLEAHGADPGAAEALAESTVSIQALDRLAADVTGPALNAAVRAIAAGCATRTLAAEIESAVGRIHDLVAAVKGFTYMDQAATPIAVDLRKGLNDTVAVVHSKAKTRSIAVSVAVDPDLPAIVGLGGQLNQVWLNLIDNALDAAPASGHVDVVARRRDHGVAVSITDNGPGIPDDVRPRLFEPFFTTKPVGSGTGLGLDMARKIVEQHGGHLTFESRPGQTTFTVTLPGAPAR